MSSPHRPSWLKQLFHSWFSRSQPIRLRPGRTCRPIVEPLEDRWLPAAPVTVAYVSGTFAGDANNQAIADADFGTNGNQPATFGVDAFATIGAALAALPSSGEVIVNSGTYAEAVDVTNSQTLTITGLDVAGAVTINSLTTDLGTTVQIQGSSSLTDGDANDTTAAGNITGGGTLTKVGNGTLTLSGNNTYSGATTITAGTLKAGSATALTSATNVTDNDTLDLNGNSISIGSLSGTGDVIDGGGAATLTVTGGGTFGGTISGANTALTVAGTTQTLTLSDSIYGGKTTINSGDTLQASSTTAFSSTSAVSDSGTLDLAGFGNSIGALNGAGSVIDSGGSATLTVTGGGSFSGNITGAHTALTVQGGTLTLSGNNTYSGDTTISIATLKAGSATALTSATSVTDDGTLDLNGNSISIGALSGGGGVTDTGGAATLTVTGGGYFSGAIVGNNTALTVGGTTQTLTLAGSSSYSGQTTINSGDTLQAGSTSAFSSHSAVSDSGTLDLDAFSNSIGALNGTGSVINSGAAATLTVTGGGSFSGNITGATTALTVLGGTLTLSGNNTYSGDTTLSGGTLKAGSTTALTSATSVTDNGILDLNGYSISIGTLSGSTGGVQNSGAAATLTVTGGGTFSGHIVGANTALTVAGTTQTLTLAGSGTYGGQTTINSGDTLQAGSTSAFSPFSAVSDNGTLDLASFSNVIGALNGTGSVINSGAAATLRVTAGGSFSGNITGATTALRLVSAGILTLSGNNTYSGATTIDSGTTLAAGSTTALTSATSVTANGSLDLGGNSISIGALGGGGGVIDSGAAATLTVTGGGTFGGGITGSNTALTVGGTTQTLILARPSSYAGQTTINSGDTLKAGGTNAFSQFSDISDDGTLDLAGFSNAIGALTGTGSVIDSGGAATLTVNGGSFSGNITGANTALKVAGGAPTLTLSGDNTYGGATTITTGTLVAGSTTALTSATNVTDNDNLDLGGYSLSIGALSGSSDGSVFDSGSAATLTVTGGGTFSGIISNDAGPLALTVNGPGNTLILSGPNTYTGATKVTAGTLEVDGSITSNVTNSGTLDGSGTVSGNVSGTGTFSPGDAPGIMTINGTFTPTGTVNFEVNAPYATAGTDYDQYKISGTVNLSGATLTFTNNIAGAFPAQPTQVTLISNTSGSATTPGSPADGASLALGANTVKLFYNSGAGHDVVLESAYPPVDGYHASSVTHYTLLQTSGILELVNTASPSTVLATQPLANDPVTITGSNSSDVFTVDFSTFNATYPFPSGGVTWNAGNSNNGTLDITGEMATTETYSFTDAHSGSVNVDGALVHYTGLSPINDNGSAVNRIFTYTASGGAITVAAASAGNDTISATTGETVTFPNPTASLEVDANTGSNSITINQLDSAFNAGLTLNATGATTSAIVLNTSYTSGDAGNVAAHSGGSVSVTAALNVAADTIGLSAGTTITQTAPLTAGALTTSSATGTTLGSANAVASFTATNTTSGNISLTDATALTVVGINQAGPGNVSVSSTGSDTALTVTQGVTGSGGSVTLQATGNLTVGTKAIINSGSGPLTLAADVTTAGAGDNGVGTLTVSAGAGVYGANITLRGADEDIASTANVGSASAVAPAVSTFVDNTHGLNGPTGLAFDAAGNLYVANQSSNTISKVTPGGSVSTFVDNTHGLNAPFGLAFDAAGNLYVANGGANTISKVTPGGSVSTFVDNTHGLNEPLGLAFDAAGNLYVANFNGDTISEVTPGGSVSTFVDNTHGLSLPTGLAFDAAGNLYVANQFSGTISKVTPGGAVSTFVDNTHGLNGPNGLAFDAAGNLYVVNRDNETISKVTPGGSVSTFVDNTHGLNQPIGLAFDAAGNLYVANAISNTISKVIPAIVATTSLTIQSSVESRPMEIGGSNNAAVSGINLTSAELARIVTSSGGTVTIGDSNQTGNITFDTATPATTTGAATVVVESTSGAGQIILDNHTGGTGTALSGNTGTVAITAGTGGIVEAAGNASGTADIGNASAVSLTSSGPIGTSSNPVQLGSTSLTTNTSANSSNQFLAALTSVTITSLNAGTGTIHLAGGTFNLSGNNQISASSTLEVDAGAFNVGTHSNTVAKLTLKSAATIDFTVNGTTPGTNQGQLTVPGAVSLGGATLQVTGTIASHPGQVITLINNEGNSPPDTFNGLPQGSVVIFNGEAFLISYVGGVSLTNIPFFVVNSLSDASQPPARGLDLRQAIALANSNPGSLIAFNVNGPIILTQGELTLSEPMMISALTPPHSIAIDGFGKSRIFNITTPGTVTIKGLTIKDGNTGNANNAAPADGLGNGGGVYDGNGSSILVLTADTIEVNTAVTPAHTTGGNGGGVYTAGVLTLNGTMIENNSAGGNGGGIDALRNITLNSGSIVSNNIAAGSGGGIYQGNTGTTVTLNNSTVTINKALAGNGGGIWALFNVVLNSSVVSSNLALGATATEDANCVITETNGFGNGGGIYSDGGNVTGTGATVTGNIATGEGGGIWADFDVILTASNIGGSASLGNIGDIGGGGIWANDGFVKLFVTFVSGNTAGAGTTITNETFSQGDGGGIWSGTDVTIDASLVTGNNANGNGGGIYANRSVTIDISTVSNNTATTTCVDSETGNSMNGDGGGIYALLDVTVVTGFVTGNTATLNGGGIASLGGNVDVNSGSVIGTLGFGNSAFDGGGIWDIGGNVSIDTSFVGYNFADDDGGGVFVSGDQEEAGSLYVNSSTFRSNTAVLNGGAIFVSFSEAVTINFGSFFDNSATNGGAIYTQFIENVTITGSLFTGNYAHSGSGGALYVIGPVDLYLLNDNFTNNKADISGGAVYLVSAGETNSIATIYSCNFDNNVSFGGSQSGSALFVDSNVEVDLNLSDFDDTAGLSAALGTDLIDVGNSQGVFGVIDSSGGNAVWDNSWTNVTNFAFPGSGDLENDRA